MINDGGACCICTTLRLAAIVCQLRCTDVRTFMLTCIHVNSPMHASSMLHALPIKFVAVSYSVLCYMQVIVGIDYRIGCTSVSQEVWAFCPMQPTQRHTTFTTCSPNTTVLCILFIGIASQAHTGTLSRQSSSLFVQGM